MEQQIRQSVGRDTGAPTYWNSTQKMELKKEIKKKSLYEKRLAEENAELEEVYQDAPAKVKNIVKRLKNPDNFPLGESRWVIFYGPPGMGKTKLAMAVADQTGYTSEFFTCGDFTLKERGAAAEKLTNIFNQIVKSGQKTILIIDELNQLLENYDSKHHDTDATSKALWTLLDRNKKIASFYFIGLMNRIDKLPPQIQGRILARCIPILAPQNPLRRKQILRNKLISEGTILSAELDAYIDQNIDRYASYSVRDFEELAFAIKEEALSELPEEQYQTTIELRHLQTAESFINTIKKDMKYNEEKISDEERRHRESMHQQKAHHEESIALQIKHHQESMIKQDHNHLQSMQLQKELHTESLKQQDQNQQSSSQLQRELHQDGITQQKNQHEQSLQSQQKLHEESVAEQKKAQKENIQLQEKLHQENLFCQKRLHDESAKLQVESNKKSLETQIGIYNAQQFAESNRWACQQAQDFANWLAK